ncbi:MAG: dihydropyrimidinase [Gemmobacter sp.]
MIAGIGGTMAVDLAIRGGQVVTPSGVVATDIGVTGGRIVVLGPCPDARRVIDAEGRMVMPGGIDPHAHVEQVSGMGLMNADTFETATAAAALGGTTTVISFAAQARGERLRDTVGQYAARAVRGARIDHAFHLTLTDLTVPGFADDLAALVAAGHRSVKLFTTYAIGLTDRQVAEVMGLLRGQGALVCVHAENDGLLGWTRDAALAAGMDRPLHHAVAHPRLAELDAVERMCRYAAFFGQPVMVFHVTTAEAADAVRRARARGVPVMAETCPHYLFQTAQVLDRDGIEGAKWMCSPPQRGVADQAALWAALGDGTLDLVSSDHAPYRFDATGKLAAGPLPPFPAIANGLPGLQQRLPLMFDAMVAHGRGGPVAFARATAGRAAEVYGLPSKGAIDVGCDADLVLWDPARKVTYGADDMADGAGYNPWEGTTVTGWPETVLSRGAVIVDKGVLTAAPGRGRWLSRGPVAGAEPAAEVRYVEGRR